MGHLRGLAEEFGESTNSIRKELNNLCEAGLIIKSEDKNRVDYKANPDHAFFTNLQDLIQKYLGLDQLILAVLERMGQVSQIALVGDYARGINSGRIEVEITGNQLNEDYLEHVSKKLKSLIDKEVVFQIKPLITDPEALFLYNQAD
uniref:ArsR family transcriptional regulator n=1 Tax=Algoriphagus sp. TaxID=1872435 RepID=UPI00404840FB